MQQHLSEEDLVLFHYHDDAAPPDAAAHVASCAECRAQLAALRNVLSLVDQSTVPEKSDRYGEEVWNRLRWKLGARPRRRNVWISSLAAAAVLAIAFFAGQLWHARNQANAPTAVAHQTSAGSTVQAVANNTTTMANSHPDRVLIIVVSDHLDSAERVLVELANADPKKQLEFGAQEKRAGELVASNRIYRQAAAQGGETRIAAVLGDLEPMLVELSHAGSTLTPAELGSLQKRIEEQGLLFKVRVAEPELKTRTNV